MRSAVTASSAAVGVAHRRQPRTAYRLALGLRDSFRRGRTPFAVNGGQRIVSAGAGWLVLALGSSVGRPAHCRSRTKEKELLRGSTMLPAILALANITLS